MGARQVASLRQMRLDKEIEGLTRLIPVGFHN